VAGAPTCRCRARTTAAPGRLGPWQVAGHTPSPVSECTATADGNHLYVIDGLYEDPADAGQVLTADLDDIGHLGPLAAMGKLPDGVVAISSEASVRDGELLLMHSELPAEGDTTVTLHTPLAGAIAWTTDDWHVGFHAQAQYAFTRDTVVMAGGYGDQTAVLADVFVATGGTVMAG
jgi:hypothetical protein